MLYNWFWFSMSQTEQMVLIDFQKAFNRINHAIILEKLATFGDPDFLV